MKYEGGKSNKRKQINKRNTKKNKNKRKNIQIKMTYPPYCKPGRQAVILALAPLRRRRFIRSFEIRIVSSHLYTTQQFKVT